MRDADALVALEMIAQIVNSPVGDVIGGVRRLVEEMERSLRGAKGAANSYQQQRDAANRRIEMFEAALSKIQLSLHFIVEAVRDEMMESQLENFIASYAVPGLRELNNLLGTVASANQTTATKPSGMYYCAECDDDIRPTEDHYSTCSKARRCGGPATGTDNHARDDKGGYWDGWADGREAADAKIDAAERERDTLRDLLARKEAGEAEFVALRNHQMQAAYKREEDERQRADAAEREAQEHFDNYQEMGEQVVQRDRRIVELEAALKQMPHDSCVEENLPRCKYEGCGDGGGMDWEAAVCNIARAALAAPASPATANQCDGCRAGRPIDANGNHRMGDGEYGDLMHCQREKYVNLDTHSKEPK